MNKDFQYFLFFTAEKCHILESSVGTFLVRNFHHNITSVDISHIVGRCHLNKDYKVLEGSRFRVNKKCGAKFKVCHKVGKETQAPKTKAPKTKAPETKAPTTAAPKTAAPTTAAPITLAPITSEAISVKAMTTAAPTTPAPTTPSPTTPAPTTLAPTTLAPTKPGMNSCYINY